MVCPDKTCSSDNLWYARWQQILSVGPGFVEIISWNDYGESHYIGPLREHAMATFGVGQAPYNYVTNMPHDGWRLFLPFLVDAYKFGTATIDKEGLTVWHRPQPAAAVSSDGTTGNTASQHRIEFSLTKMVQDHIFFSALLGSPAKVTVTVGGVALPASWARQPEGDVGIYHGSVLFESHREEVAVTLHRNSRKVAQAQGSSISTDCTQGLRNWNAWVGSSGDSESVNAGYVYDS